METIVFLLSMLERVTTCGIMLAMDFATRFVKARTAMTRGASTDMRKVIGLALERFQASEGFCCFLEGFTRALNFSNSCLEAVQNEAINTVCGWFKC